MHERNRQLRQTQPKSYLYCLKIFFWCGPFLSFYWICDNIASFLSLFFFFFFGLESPWPGIEPAAPVLEGKVPTTGWPGKSQWAFLKVTFREFCWHLRNQNYLTEAQPPPHPRLQERLGNAVGIFCFNLGTWLSQLGICQSRSSQEWDIWWDDVEIKNIHPTVFVWWLSASVEST